PLLELFLQQDSVRAQIDVFAARHQLGHERADIRVHERLTAGDRYHRCAALLHGGQALRHSEMLAQDVAGILDLAAPCAREVAAEQRLEHQAQGIAAIPTEPLLEDVGRDGPHLRQRNAHAFWLSKPGPMAGRRRTAYSAKASTTCRSRPSPSRTHSPIHAVTAKLNASTA